MSDIEKIISGCIKMNRKSQRELYDLYAPLFLGIARRYAKTREDAEDILQDSFVKIFVHIAQYNACGSFEGWMKRILINTAISHYHEEQKKDIQKDFEEIKETDIENFNFSDSDFTQEELLNAISTLPTRFKIIFNLYAIEGYKHREIAEMLDISVGTSKSQYSRARTLLQEKLKGKNSSK